MSDDQPRERPDFVAPEGDPAESPYAAPDPSPPSPVPPQAAYPPPPASYPSSEAPYPPPQPAYPPPGGYPQPPFRAAAPPPRTGRGSILLGIVITLATLGLSLWLSTSVPYDNPLASVTSGAAVVAPVALIIVGIVLAAIPKTSRTGAGLLLGLGAAVLIAGGLCFALLLTFP